MKFAPGEDSFAEPAALSWDRCLRWVNGDATGCSTSLTTERKNLWDLQGGSKFSSSLLSYSARNSPLKLYPPKVSCHPASMHQTHGRFSLAGSSKVPEYLAGEGPSNVQHHQHKRTAMRNSYPGTPLHRSNNHVPPTSFQTRGSEARRPQKLYFLTDYGSSSLINGRAIDSSKTARGVEENALDWKEYLSNASLVAGSLALSLTFRATFGDDPFLIASQLRNFANSVLAGKVLNLRKRWWEVAHNCIHNTLNYISGSVPVSLNLATS